MRPAFTGSPASIKLVGTAIPGAEDRQRKVPGFDQAVLSNASVICIGAGGIVSPVALTLVRKGIGRITFLDADVVESSNLNRQRFFATDMGNNKAVALAENLLPECIVGTEIRGFGVRLEEAIATDVDLSAAVAICGVDNNPARVCASRHFRSLRIPVIFAGVSRDGDHGYVFVQGKDGPCIGCLYPDMADDDRYPCPGTPAIADILQALAGFVVYALDSLLMERVRQWNYRRISLSDAAQDGGSIVRRRDDCRLCVAVVHQEVAKGRTKY